MNRQRFQSHWKELLAIRNTDSRADAEPDQPAGADEASSARGVFHTALDVLHRYRYGWLAATCSVLCVCLFAVYGRDDGRPDRVRVSGQVLLDGHPLARGTILFVPQDARPSAATLDDQGRFELTCFAGTDGAVPGSHHVAVAPGGIPTDPATPWPVAAHYADHRTSGLTVDIAEPTDALLIELTTPAHPPRSELLRAAGLR